MTDDALRVMVEKTTIFARFSPDEKNRIILALKANGHVVGYMGDGINDAPSLKTADVGISVENAVDVAKESAEIILTHKSLKELLDGIVEGRRTFSNSMQYLMMGISSNFGNMFSVLGAVIFLPFLPMLPTQILLNNLLYDISQIAIPKDNVDEEYISAPKRWDMKFIKKFMIVFGLISSFYDFATFGFLYFMLHSNEAVFRTGWFLESMATQVLIIHFIRTKRLPFIQSTAHPALIATTLGVVVIAWILPFTPLAKLLGFEPLSLTILLGLAAIVIAYLITAEIAKRFFYSSMTERKSELKLA
jgi:Mg2+-importing ATPase